MKKTYYLLTAVLVLVTALLVGCNGSSDQEFTQPAETRESTQRAEKDVLDSGGSENEDLITPEDSIRLSVTSGYGREIIHESLIPYEEGWTVYDLMLSEVTIETQYGGSFISGINGLASTMSGPDGLRMDWFYYVNGICADLGVMDCELSPGDSIWWDYHSWTGGGASNPSVTGGYPEVFLRGYNGRSGQVQILFTEGFEEKAAAVATHLEGLGAESIHVQAIDGNESMLADRVGPTMVIGDWQQLSTFDTIADLNGNYEKTGQFIHFDSDGTMGLANKQNEVLKTIYDAGAVFTSGQGLGDGNPLWIVTGTEGKTVDKAVKILLEDPGILRNSYSVYVNEDGVGRLPLFIDLE